MFTRCNFRMLLLYFVLLCSLPATFPLDPLTSGFKGKRSLKLKFLRNKHKVSSSTVISPKLLLES